MKKEFFCLMILLVFPVCTFGGVILSGTPEPTPCGKKDSCELVVKSVERVVVMCDDGNPGNDRGPVPTNECTAKLTAKNKKQEFWVFVGTKGCDYKVGQKIQLKVRPSNCSADRWGSDAKCSEGPNPHVTNLDKLDIKTRVCQIGLNAWQLWIDDSLK